LRASKRTVLWSLVLLCVGVQYSISRAELLSAGQAVDFTTQDDILDVPGPSEARGDIRVRIFPHHYNYAPHGIDRQVEELRLISKDGCNISRAHQEHALPIGAAVETADQLYLHAANLRQAIWVECDGPVLLQRAPGLPSYEYEGRFYIKSARKKGGRRYLLVVNIVDIETYLRGVVPSEVYPSWPEESLKTQTVAARTYAVFHRSNQYGHAKNFYDVDDTISYQAYTGLTEVHPRTDAAIDATKGQIMTFGGKPIEAYYHADSGGVVDTASAVWGVKAPYTTYRHEVVQEDVLQSTTWQKVISEAALRRHLQGLGALEGEAPIKSLAVVKESQTRGGRVQELQALTSRGERVVFGIRELRRLVSLPSTLFTIEKTPSGWNLHGRGSGHGVGLSQRGALALAQHRDWDYKKILEFYYPEAKLCASVEQSGLDACD